MTTLMTNVSLPVKPVSVSLPEVPGIVAMAFSLNTVFSNASVLIYIMEMQMGHHPN
jgi:biotin transporter BioY